MKRTILLLCALAVMAGASALDLQLRNGDNYHDVTVLGTDSNGAWIRVSPNPGSYFIKRVSYSELTPGSYVRLTEFTNAMPSNVLEQIRQRFGEIAELERTASIQAHRQMLLQPFGEMAQLNNPEPWLPGVPLAISLDSIVELGTGTVGWADSNAGYSNNIPYGRIYVYDLSIPQLNRWGGTVYPTNKTITYRQWVLPCFTVNPINAVRINRQTW